MVREPALRQPWQGAGAPRRHRPAISPLRDSPVEARPAPGPLVGRDELITELEATGTDLALYGEPGVGKTFLLRHLCQNGWGLFLVDDDREALANAVRSKKPDRIIVDDAHFTPDVVVRLKQLREDLEAKFSIVATTWKDWQPDIAARVPDAQRIEVPRLARDETLQVIEEMGLSGPVDLQRMIVNQARGRPGLAATLVHACRVGRVRGVARGEELLRETVSAFGPISGAGDALPVLAVIALGDSFGLDPTVVASALGSDLPSVFRTVREVASGGIIDTIRGSDGIQRLVVQPDTLRYALVHEVFFGDRPSLPLGRVMRELPEAAAALMPLLYARHLGVQVDDVLLRRLLSTRREVGVLQAYAALGEAELDYALSLAPDQRGALAEAALRTVPERAICELLESSGRDKWPQHSSPSHGLRRLADYVQSPDDTLARRQLVFKVVRYWLAGGREPAIAIEAMSLALKPGVELSWADAGAGNKITISRGSLDGDALRRLAPLWNELIAVAVQHAAAWEPVIDTLGDWCWPDRVTVQSGKVAEATHREARSGARRAVRRLADESPDRPAVRARLKRLSMQAGLGIKVDVDVEFEALFPTREFPRGDFSAEKQHRLEQRQRARAYRLAREWAARDIEEVAEKIAWFEREVSIAGATRYPWMTPYVCRELAVTSERPDLWISALRDADVPAEALPDLIHPFLGALRTRKPRGWHRVVRQLLDDEVTVGIAVAVSLREPLDQALLSAAVSACDSRVAGIVEGHFRSFSPAAKRALLRHPDDEVARGALVGAAREGLVHAHDETIAAWEEALARCPADDTWVPAALERRPYSVPRWIEGWVQRQSRAEWRYERVPDKMLSLVRGLALDERVTTLKSLPVLPPLIGEEVIAALVGDDPETTRVLLRRQDLNAYHRIAVCGPPNEAWLRRAEVAVSEGWQVERVVAASQFAAGVTSHWGPESEHFASLVEAFRKIANGDGEFRRVVSDAGVRYLGSLRDQALQDERRETIYGRD